MLPSELTAGFEINLESSALAFHRAALGGFRDIKPR